MKAKKLGRGLWEGAYKPGDGRLEVKLNQGSGILGRKREWESREDHEWSEG